VGLGNDTNATHEEEGDVHIIDDEGPRHGARSVNRSKVTVTVPTLADVLAITVWPSLSVTDVVLVNSTCTVEFAVASTS
jgi:hypothetical protein